MAERPADTELDQPSPRQGPSIGHLPPAGIKTLQLPPDPLKPSLPDSSYALSSDQHIELSRPIFRSCWFFALAIHCVCAAFYILIALLYHYLTTTVLIWTVVLYSLSIDMSEYPLVTAVHAILAAGHIFEILKMLLLSIYHRQLVFKSPPAPKKSEPSNSERVLSATQRRHPIQLWMYRLVSKASQRWSILGHEEEFAQLRMALRVTLDIALLSYQCYRMSWYLSRMWLQRLYVAMLVINCWSDPLIQFVIHRTKCNRQLLKARAFVDLTLDFMSVIVIPSVLLHTYYDSYDLKRRDFPRAFYYDDKPLMRFLNEFKLLLVYSGLDLLQRLLLGSDLLICGETMKSLLRPATRQSSICPKGDSKTTIIKSDGTGIDSKLDDVVSTQERVTGSTDTTRGLVKPRKSIGVARMMTKIIHALFIVWGLVVACAQLYAEVKPMSADCVIVVRPWFRAKPGCALIELSGAEVSADQETQEAIARRLVAFDDEAVSYLILSHHPALSVPTNIKNLRNLVGLKMNNVTLTEWRLRLLKRTTRGHDLFSLSDSTHQPFQQA